MNKNLPFRAWFYFRQGWATYIAFMFASINTLVVTYYLAIENAPYLKEIFPTFLTYVIVLISMGIPLLITIGYVHYKRSPAFKNEAEIAFEANPPLLRTLLNTEIILPLFLQMSNYMIKLSNGEKLSEADSKELEEIKQQIKEHISKKLSGKFDYK